MHKRENLCEKESKRKRDIRKKAHEIGKVWKTKSTGEGKVQA